MQSNISSNLTSFRQKCHGLVVKKLLRRRRAHPEDSAVAGPHEELLDHDPTESHESVQVHSNPFEDSPLRSSSHLSDSMDNSEQTPLVVSTEECTFCSFMSFSPRYYNDSEDSNSIARLEHGIFHDDCPSCSSVGVPLCEVCQHLRLPHLLMCLPRDIPCYGFNIILNSHFWNRKDCKLCEFLANGSCFLLPKAARPADMSFTQLKLFFTRQNEPQQSTHAHWNLRMGINWNCENSSVVSDESGIDQMFLRDVCAGCNSRGLSFTQSGGLIEWKSIPDWLSYCDVHHRISCSVITKPPLPPEFRVIDVDSRYVIQIPDCEFVALSYVWGSRPASPSYVEEATRKNIKALSSTGLVELPKTIEDAISICKHINKKYLWVDRYCIVQDDEENKHSQISAMADIFAASDSTIVVCSGASVESGIPGVTKKLQEQKRITFNDIALIHKPSTIRLVTESVWNSRGWTYQEAILARKTLFLTPTSVYYSCNRYCYPGVGVFTTDFHTIFHFDAGSNFQNYTRHIHNYTSRRLSYDDDIYYAFEGITKALYGNESSFHFGIPAIEFDRGLLWISTGFSCLDCESCEHDDRKDFKPDETHQNSVENRHYGNDNNRPNSKSCRSDDRYLRFCNRTTPSWSWASLKWPVHFMAPEYFTITLVKWIMYKDEKSEIRSISINATHESGLWPHQTSWTPWKFPGYQQINFAMAITERCIEADIKCRIPKRDSFKKLEKKFVERWPEYIDAYDELPEISPKEGPRSDGLLFTRAQSAFFYIDSHWIKNSEGLTIGYVFQDPRLHQIQAMASHNLSMEFIALSISSYPVPCPETRSKAFDQPNWFYWTIPEEQYRDMTYFDCNDLPLLPVPAVNVMLICWADGFARRVTVGLIMLKQWAKAERKFKDVWLK